MLGQEGLWAAAERAYPRWKHLKPAAARPERGEGEPQQEKQAERKNGRDKEVKKQCHCREAVKTKA